MIWEQIGQHEALYIVAFFFIVELLLTFPTWFSIWEDILISVHRGTQLSLPQGSHIAQEGSATDLSK